MLRKLKDNLSFKYVKWDEIRLLWKKSYNRYVYNDNDIVVDGYSINNYRTRVLNGSIFKIIHYIIWNKKQIKFYKKEMRRVYMERNR